MGGSELVWRINPKVNWGGQGVTFSPVRAPTDGNRSCYQWLEGSNFIGPPIPKWDRFIRNLNIYFSSLPQSQQQTLS